MYLWNADSVNYLGILIDKCLNCKTHIDLIALKISKIVGMIAKNKTLCATLCYNQVVSVSNSSSPYIWN